MQEFLSKHFQKDFTIKSLGSDGGHREYFRVSNPNKSLIFLKEKPFDPLKDSFFISQKLLKNHGVRVPEIVDFESQKGFIFLEDLGSLTLEKEFENTKSLKYYKQALIELIKIQKIKAEDFLDLKKEALKQELLKAYENIWTLFLQNSNLAQKDLLKDFENLSTEIMKDGDLLVHRDFHSRNLMIKDQKLFCIDFQDLSHSSSYYDLTSLLYDSYVSLSDNQKKELIKEYKVLSQSSQSEDEIFYKVKLQFLQRGIKACSAFASFYNNKKKETHLHFIAPTVQNLILVCEELKKYPAYLEFLKNIKMDLQNKRDLK